MSPQLISAQRRGTPLQAAQELEGHISLSCAQRRTGRAADPASSLNFLWPDQNQRLVSLPAPTYIDFVMSWLQKLLDDESVFPTKSGASGSIGRSTTY